MRIELNIQSEEFLYESQILINAFLAEWEGNEENPEWNDKTLSICIQEGNIKVCF